jgi:hypothetical protein
LDALDNLDPNADPNGGLLMDVDMPKKKVKAPPARFAQKTAAKKDEAKEEEKEDVVMEKPVVAKKVVAKKKEEPKEEPMVVDSEE